MMMKKIIAMVRAEVWQTCSSALRLSRPLNHASSIAPNAPTAPASLGVENPKRIAPLIMVIRSTGGMNAFRMSGSISPFGTWSRSGGNGGAVMGAQDRAGPHVQEIHDRKGQTRDDGGHEDVADRHREKVGHDDQHDAGRDENPEGPRRGDGSAREAVAVALAHHGGEGQRRHHRHRGADDSGHCGQDRAHDGDRERERPGDALQQHLYAVEQVVGDARCAPSSRP